MYILYKVKKDDDSPVERLDSTGDRMCRRLILDFGNLVGACKLWRMILEYQINVVCC